MPSISSLIRPLAFYILAIVGGSIYGGRVCPFLELLTWQLDLTILLPLAIAFGLRLPVWKRLVAPKPAMKQAAAQFRMELCLFTLAAVASALILYFVYDLPLFSSGLKLFVGLFTIGLFAGLDMGLARQRELICAARDGRAEYRAPERVLPMPRRMALTASLILLLGTLIILLVVTRDLNWLAVRGLNMDNLPKLGHAVLKEVSFVVVCFMGLVINLIYSNSRNMQLLFTTQTRILERVAKGDLSHLVPVTTANELGLIAGRTNDMIFALRDRMRMREGLLIAKEVQQHFLPAAPPRVEGLDIAGVSLFSDETGGDFYDFIDCEPDSCGQLAIAMGDVAGHGVGAALLMAEGRALIRQNAATPGPAADNITMANWHLTRDMGETGRFLTLFFMLVDPLERKVSWVNAGHIPPLVYCPDNDDFTELRGEDIPLGVIQDWQFHEHAREYPAPGQVVLMITDGVWEARNKQGEMFGEKRVREVIRNNHAGSAKTIMDALIRAVEEFSGRGHREDDLTAVVLKGVEKGT